MEIHEENCKPFGDGRMRLCFITLQIRLKKQNKQTTKIIY